ncbi:unnamed protein product [Vitrella brassicaformis CCMP3155]|uniref:PPM-type phosphatase domain-containing protein n=1 Tax=Vitrella brassicaformis (strain CCMP3155) TaxID=1169540 RepID=A0A0G4FJ63_VITBC|nr:unnamed protein product [Vitrella brassicaformis CCMP3155]|mmetsp:Transcript_4696/g.10878  ORF Transcript_4696/g.10878 Transcript_4696/m.10878 type:complete len:337 (-) Transcript_4696:343-1353(-)|eukprot:CEM13816.1 unnamed protein product [Vitrella brassicaformis CCMP3155]
MRNSTALPAKEQRALPVCIHSPIPPTEYPRFALSVFTTIGGRKYQEDRFTICPNLIEGRDNSAFFGVFDGTVGDFASENVKDLVIPHLIASPAWASLEQRYRSSSSAHQAHHPPLSDHQLGELLQRAMRDMYTHADRELITMCATHQKHYASTTSVTVLIFGGLCCVAHLGDSRAAIGIEKGSGYHAQFLTHDHKPDQPNERKRIESSGGSVEYLHNHNNKPFIRGGDFTVRKQKGEQPMQLQYSRAFGGKDLKNYGLSSEPDISLFKMEKTHKFIILASDGLWDVFTAEQAVSTAASAVRQGHSAAEALVNAALSEQQSRQANADNITAIVVCMK